MKKITFLILIIVLSLPKKVIAQNNKELDSLLKVYKSQINDSIKVKTINKIAVLYWYINPNKSIQFAKEGLDLSVFLNYKYGQGLMNQTYGTAHAILGTQDSARIYWGKSMKIFKSLKEYSQVANLNRNLAILGYETGNYKVALKHINESINIYSKKVQDSLGLGNAYDTQSKVHIYQGNFRMALNSALKSLKILEKINAPVRLAHAYNNLGIIEFYNTNYQKSIDYNERALAVYRKENNKWWSAQALNDIGNSYYYLEDYDNALIILTECVALAREVDNKSVLGTSLNNLGKTFTALKKYEKAIPELKASLKIAQDRSAKNKVVERLNDLGNTYFGKRNINKSLEYYNRAIALADSIGAKDNLKNGYYFRSKAYATINDYKKAYSDSEILRVLKDTIYNETKSQQIQELLTIYETDKKEQLIY